jgi:hypothetical protein
MSLQVALEKDLEKINFFEASVYEKHDLTNLIRPDEKFVVRQGDLVITNYLVSDSRKRGLRHAWMQKCKNVWIFGGNHFIIPLKEETIIVHPEHGIITIPLEMGKLNFYTFNEAKD